MDDDDEPGRFDIPDSLMPLSRAARKFGFGKCALATCGEKFTKHQHKQRYCCPSHQQQAADRRAGKFSADPRWALKRERQRRLAARAGAFSTPQAPRMIPTTGGPGERPKYHNENNNLQRPFLPSTYGISGCGASRGDFCLILAYELGGIPVAVAAIGRNTVLAHRGSGSR